MISFQKWLITAEICNLLPAICSDGDKMLPGMDGADAA
jgi:hypothetical protein